jgi:hypothetical protein
MLLLLRLLLVLLWLIWQADYSICHAPPALQKLQAGCFRGWSLMLLRPPSMVAVWALQPQAGVRA